MREHAGGDQALPISRDVRIEIRLLGYVKDHRISIRRLEDSAELIAFPPESDLHPTRLREANELGEGRGGEPTRRHAKDYNEK